MKRTLTMKTMFLTLAALLGVAIGATTLASSAQASTVYLYPPSDSTG